MSIVKRLLAKYDAAATDRDSIKGMEFHIEMVEALGNINEYHKPGEKEIKAYDNIRKAVTECMVTIMESCPPCDDRMNAINQLREVRMKANSAIALKGAF